MAKPQDKIVDAKELEQIRRENPNLDFPVTPVVVNGKTMYKLGASRADSSDVADDTIYTLEQVQQIETDSGTTYAKYPAPLPDGTTGYRLGKSYAPEGIEGLNVFQQKTAEEFQSDARFWISDKTAPRLNALNNLAIYEDALNQLESGAVVIGDTKEKILGLLAGIGMDDPIRAFINPNSQDVYDNIRSVVMLGLRETLGAQFTEREGNRLVRASYNPNLTAEQNAKRLRRMATLLKDTIAYKDMLSDMALSEEGIVSLVKGTQGSLRSYLDSQLNILEHEYNQDALLNGTPTIPTNPQDRKPPIIYPKDVQDIINKYSS
jgi:hypothetical protein